MGACQSRKAFKAALKKRKMDRPTKGDRSGKKGHRVGTTPSPLNSASPTSTTPSPRITNSLQRNEPKTKRLLKTNLKDGSKTSLSAPLHTPLVNKSRPSIRDSAGSSPATLHGRTPLKTSTVSPAPPNRASPHPTSLTRFGFRGSSPRIKNGDSTDSVNSILSDAQTVSDSNSNISDLFENENGNDEGGRKIIDGFCDIGKQIPRPTSSPTVSQASSGVTSSLNKCLKAQTRQLPKPQNIAVKSVNVKSKFSSNNSINSVRSHTPGSLRKGLPAHSVSSPSMQMDISSRKTVQTNNTNSDDKITRTSRDSESSTKSITTVDSGLGSSSESDKLRLEVDSDTLIGRSESEDLSDIWLREKRSTLSDTAKKESTTKMEVIFNETSYAQMNGKQMNGYLNHEIPQQIKETLKEKRETPITYGMARQKFAPYSRNRFGYSNTIKSPTSTNSFKTSSNITPPGATKIQNSGVGSFVRSRILQLEKTPAVKFTQQTNQSRTTSLKRPIVRPTSFEKPPSNLVTPVYEKTVEISRPICRKLEYSEETKNSKLEHKLSSSSINSNAEDILMVSSVEKEKETPIDNKELIIDNLKKDEANEVVINEVNFIPIKVSKDNLDVKESKSTKDISENEKNTEENKDNKTMLDTSLTNTKDAEQHTVSTAIEEDNKMLSPGSEPSFEILESIGDNGDDISTENMEDIENINELVDQTKITCTIFNDIYMSNAGINNSTGPKPPKKTKNNNVSSPCDVQCQDNIYTESVTPMETKELPDIVQVKEQNNVMANSATSITSSIEGKAVCDVVPSLKSVMTTSYDSQKSFGNPLMGDSTDRSNMSGKCTPTLNSTRGDIDQDFLIDDEISDQPGLTFGDTDLGTSFFDDDIFGDELPPLSPSHSNLKTVPMERSRTASVCTTSSAGGDDLMLDYDHLDMEDGTKVLFQTEYEEDVLSPDASEIFNEWTAMMAEMGGTEPMSLECVTHDSGSSEVSSSPRHHPPTSKLPRPRSACSSTGDLSGSPRHIPSRILKPPRQGEVIETEGGGISLDRTSYHYLCQDVTTVKTKLLQLKRILNSADTINPFDSNHRSSLYLSLGASESPGGGDKDTPPSVADLAQENVDLKRQVVLLQQQLEEKDRAVRLLQQQLSHALQVSTTNTSTSTSTSIISTTTSACSPPPVSPSTSPVQGEESNSDRLNAATQTDRTPHRPTFAMASLSRTGSIDDGLGPTVSSEVETEVEAEDAEPTRSRLPTRVTSTHRTSSQGRPSSPSTSLSSSSSSLSSQVSSSAQLHSEETYMTSTHHQEPPCTIHRTCPPQSSIFPCGSSSPVVTH